MKSDTLETCNGESLSASCGRNERLMVTSAEYGRRQMGKCITEEEPHMGCYTDVLPLLDVWCSGRQSCEYMVPNPDLKQANGNSQNTCLKYLNMYLKVEFHCMTGED